jgi:hypothetical protein
VLQLCTATASLNPGRRLHERHRQQQTDFASSAGVERDLTVHVSQCSRQPPPSLHAATTPSTLYSLLERRINGCLQPSPALVGLPIENDFGTKYYILRWSDYLSTHIYILPCNDKHILLSVWRNKNTTLWQHRACARSRRFSLYSDAVVEANVVSMGAAATSLSATSPDVAE